MDAVIMPGIQGPSSEEREMSRESDSVDIDSKSVGAESAGRKEGSAAAELDQRDDIVNSSEEENMGESGIEVSFVSVNESGIVGGSNESDTENYLQQNVELEPVKEQITKQPKKISKMLLNLSSKKSWRRNNKEESMDESEGSSLEESSGIEDSASMATFDSVSGSSQTGSPMDTPRLQALVAEQEKAREKAMEKEVEELVSTLLIGFDNEEIEKELNDHSSITHISIADVQRDAECFFASWVDRIDILNVWNGCGSNCGTRYMHDNTDGLSSEQNSVKSANSVKEKGLELKATESSDAKEIMLNAAKIIFPIEPDDAKDIILGTTKEFLLNDDGESLTIISNDDDYSDDESLLSEYDDFNKAMMMLKNRAARHRISTAMLIEKIEGEQKRRMSQGLTPTMIEI